MDVLDTFHPAVSAWFRRAFAAPTPAQVEAWPAIRAGRPVLVAAPTGSGKTVVAEHAVELAERNEKICIYTARDIA
jgi:Lhr-like helicase